MISLKTRFLLATLGCIAMLSVPCSVVADITFTGDIDSDFAGKPNTIIKHTSTVGYTLSSPPLGGAAGQLFAGAVVPSGFHISRMAVSYDCASDTFYIGYDVSNQSTLNGVPLPGLISRAWDADGDGDPCCVNNPALANLCTGPNCGCSSRVLDALLGGNNDLPKDGMSEKYKVMFDLDRNTLTDLILTAYGDGSMAGADATAVDFKGPGDQNPNHVNPSSWTDVIHLSLKKPNGVSVLTTPGVSVSLFYVQNQSLPSYIDHRDIEFRVTGLRNVSLPIVPPPPGVTPTDKPVCDSDISLLADSDQDSCGEVELDLGEFDFTQNGPPAVTCAKMVDMPQVCNLPAAVTYTLTATNTGSTPALVRIQDTALGVDQTSASCIDPGQSFSVQRKITYDATFAGHAPIVNSMTASIFPEGCSCLPCSRVSGSATCQSSATVRFTTRNPKSLPNGEQIGLGSVGVSAVFPDSLYVEPVDRRFGIRVWGAYPGIGVDDVVNVAGVLGTQDPSLERCIYNATVEDLHLDRRVLPFWLPNRLLGGGPWFYNPGTGTGQPGIWRGAGLNNIGLLVKTTGVVKPSGAGYMMIDDGSGPLKCSLPAGVQVQSSWHYVCVVGISSCEPDTGGHLNRLLKVRSGNDILPLF